MYAFAMGIVMITVGVTFMYLLPTYLVSILNATGIFTAANVATALAQIAQIQALGMGIIMIGLVFVLVGVVGGSKGKGGFG